MAAAENNYEVNLGKFIDSYMKSTHRVHIKFAMGFCGEGKAGAVSWRRLQQSQE